MSSLETWRAFQSLSHEPLWFLLSSPQPHKQRQLPVRLPAQVAAAVVSGEGAAALCGGDLRPPGVTEKSEHFCRAAGEFCVW